MSVARGRPWAAHASFGLALVLFGVAPTRVGPQDLASLLAQQRGISERWHEHLIASPFGTIHAATFSFPQLISFPQLLSAGGNPWSAGLHLASLGPDVTGAITSGVVDPPDDSVEFPSVDRTLKGDRLVPPESEPQAPAALRRQPAPQPASQPESEPRPLPAGKLAVASASPAPGDAPGAAGRLAPFRIARPDTIAPADQPVASAPPAAAETEPAGADLEASEPDDATPTLDDDESPAIRTARIYFGTEPMGGMTETLQPWGPGQHPIFEDALPTPGPRGKIVSVPRPDRAPTDAPKGGETIAGKGQVTGEGHHLKSPAERLGLAGKPRARAEKCLADAVYFEARGEPVRGQIAVAQVVMNRVFSGYYPDNVCGVVYQNANHHLACQFTFACDGIRDRITEPDAWRRARLIARNTLDGKYWLDDVGKATHYHAYWVHPWWVHEMRRLDRIGAHTFYRPRRWGDGSDSPVWGDAAATRAATKKL